MKKLAKSLWKILIIAVFVNFTACIKIENSKPEIYKIIDDNSLLIESYKLKMVHDDIIKQIPSWRAGSNGTQTLNVKVDYAVNFKANH